MLAKFEAIENVIKNLNENSILTIINTYSDLNSTEDNLYPMCDFSIINSDLDAMELLRSVDFEKFDTEDTYFYISPRTGLHCSTSDIHDYFEENFDVSDVCESLVRNWGTYAKSFSDSERYYFISCVCEEFCEWTKVQGEYEWAEDYADGVECIEKEWDKYLEELKREREEDEQYIEELSKECEEDEQND